MRRISGCVVLISVLLPWTARPASVAPSLPHFTARYINSPAGQTSLIVADRAASLFVVSNVCTLSPCPTGQPYAFPQATVQVVRTDLSGNVLGMFSFGGSGWSVATAAAIDNSGNLTIAGSSSSPDFPLVSPLQTTGNAFVAKIDPLLKGVVYSTRFGSSMPNVSTTINALTFDPAGNTYLTGTTGAGLPVTTGAFQMQGSVALGAASAYVAAIAGSGTALVFATYYSGTHGTELAGFVPLYPPVTNPRAISVDSAGNILVAGSTSDNLPVTSGSFATGAPTNSFDSTGFVAKFTPAGTGLVWGTYLPGAIVNGMLQDKAGNIVIVGTTTTPQNPSEARFSATPDALQAAYPLAPPAPGPGAGIASAAGFLLKLNPTGDKLIYSTYFGGNVVVGQFARAPAAGVSGLSADDNGNVWITGGSAPVALPANPAPALGQGYVAKLSPDLKTLLSLSMVPDGSAGVAVAATPGGTVATIGTGNLLLLGNSGAGPSFLGIAASPEFRTSSAIAPGELVTLYGIGIGPPTAHAAEVGSDGVIGNVLAATQALFNGSRSRFICSDARIGRGKTSPNLPHVTLKNTNDS